MEIMLPAGFAGMVAGMVIGMQHTMGAIDPPQAASKTVPGWALPVRLSSIFAGPIARGSPISPNGNQKNGIQWPGCMICPAPGALAGWYVTDVRAHWLTLFPVQDNAGFDESGVS